jgi:uncharacterized protein
LASPAIIIAVAMAAFVQGYSGFGFGIVTMACLALLRTPLESAAAIVSLIAVVTVVALARLSWRDGKIVWRQVALIFAGALLGVPLGYVFLMKFGNQPIGRVGLGVVLVGFCLALLSAHRTTVRLPQFLGVPIGWLSGFISGAFVSGGPPLVLYLYAQAEDPRTMKPTIQVIFLAMCLMRLVAVAFRGVLARPGVMMTAVVSIPLALAMLALGHYLSHRASSAVFTRVVQVLIGVVGVLLIVLNTMELLR